MNKKQTNVTGVTVTDVNVTEEYHKLLKFILNTGKKRTDRTGTGTLSIFDYKFETSFENGFPLITTKKLHVKSILHELLWFLKGDTNIKYLNENGVTIWDEWADSEGNLGPVYGKQWISWETKEGKRINQIQNVFESLKTEPFSRRHLVSAWNVGELEQMALPPCHWAFEFYVEEINNEKLLSLKWHQRSVDVFLGLPFNIASYGFLLLMFSRSLGMKPHRLIGDFTNVHIYQNHLEYVKEQLKRDPHKFSPAIVSLKKRENIFDYRFEDFNIKSYFAYPNWRGVPIAV